MIKKSKPESMTFATDNALGKRFEEAAKTAAEYEGLKAFLNPSEDIDGLQAYDLAIDTPEKTIFLELKMDYWSLASRNFAIEEETLKRTRADYFLIAKPSAWIIPTDILTELASGFPKKLVGQYKSPAFMVPKTALIEVAQPYWKFLKELPRYL